MVCVRGTTQKFVLLFPQATNRTKIVDRPLLVRTLPLKPTTINTVKTVPLILPNHIFEFLTFKSLLVTGCTNKLNILRTIRSAHTVFMCFVFI
jgi:hypothetical protein